MAERRIKHRVFGGTEKRGMAGLNKLAMAVLCGSRQKL